MIRPTIYATTNHNVLETHLTLLEEAAALALTYGVNSERYRNMLISIRNYPVTEMIKAVEDLYREEPPHMRVGVTSGSVMNVEESLSDFMREFRYEAQKNTEETKNLMGQLVSVIRSNNDLIKRTVLGSDSVASAGTNGPESRLDNRRDYDGGERTRNTSTNNNNSGNDRRTGDYRPRNNDYNHDQQANGRGSNNP